MIDGIRQSNVETRLENLGNLNFISCVNLSRRLLLSLLLLFLYLNSVKMCKIYIQLIRLRQNLRHDFYNDKSTLFTPNQHNV